MDNAQEFFKNRPSGLFAATLYDAISLYPNSRIMIRTFLGEEGGYVPNEWDGTEIDVATTHISVNGKYALSLDSGG